MSVLDDKTIDSMAITNDNEGIILLISDHLDWKNEYQHLKALQDKINAYISFLESEQYKETYCDNSIKYGIIEIHFLYELTKNAENFLQSVQNQVRELGIIIQYSVSEEVEDETE